MILFPLNMSFNCTIVPFLLQGEDKAKVVRSNEKARNRETLEVLPEKLLWQICKLISGLGLFRWRQINFREMSALYSFIWNTPNIGSSPILLSSFSQWETRTRALHHYCKLLVFSCASITETTHCLVLCPFNWKTNGLFSGVWLSVLPQILPRVAQEILQLNIKNVLCMK